MHLSFKQIINDKNIYTKLYNLKILQNIIVDAVLQQLCALIDIKNTF